MVRRKTGCNFISVFNVNEHRIFHNYTVCKYGSFSFFFYFFKIFYQPIEADLGHKPKDNLQDSCHMQ